MGSSNDLSSISLTASQILFTAFCNSSRLIFCLRSFTVMGVCFRQNIQYFGNMVLPFSIILGTREEEITDVDDSFAFARLIALVNFLKHLV